MHPRIRTLLAGAGIVLYLCVYAFLAVSLGAQLSDTPRFAQLGFFAIAGLAWGLPLRPLFRWLSAKPAGKPIQ